MGSNGNTVAHILPHARITKRMDASISHRPPNSASSGQLSQSCSGELLFLLDATAILCREFEKLYGITITPPNVRLLTEAELDQYVSDGGPSWKRNIVHLCAGQDIALNPHTCRNDKLEILPHEIGHAVLSAHGFEVDPYLEGGLMGPRRVLHEMVADTFQEHGLAILSEQKLIGNFVTRFFAGFNSPWSPLMDFLKEKQITMRDLLTNADGVLRRYPHFFAPRTNRG